MDNSVLQLDIRDEKSDKINSKISLIMKISLQTKEEKIVSRTACSVDKIECSQNGLSRELDIMASYIIPLGRKTMRIIKTRKTRVFMGFPICGNFQVVV